MTFPHDQIRDDIRAEEHSTATIAVVSASMVFAALFALILAIC